MTTKEFWKGFLMTVIGVLVAGFSHAPFNLEIIALTLLSTVLIYGGTNAIVFLKSDTPAGFLNIFNIVTAAVILVGQALGEIAITAWQLGAVDWGLVLKVSLSVMITYLNTTLLGGPYLPPTTKVKFLKR